MSVSLDVLGTYEARISEGSRRDRQPAIPSFSRQPSYAASPSPQGLSGRAWLLRGSQRGKSVRHAPYHLLIDHLNIRIAMGN